MSVYGTFTPMIHRHLVHCSKQLSIALSGASGISEAEHTTSMLPGIRLVPLDCFLTSVSCCFREFAGAPLYICQSVHQIFSQRRHIDPADQHGFQWPVTVQQACS